MELFFQRMQSLSFRPCDRGLFFHVVPEGSQVACQCLPGLWVAAVDKVNTEQVDASNPVRHLLDDGKQVLIVSVSLRKIVAEQKSQQTGTHPKNDNQKDFFLCGHRAISFV